MCETCGCGDRGLVPVELETSLLADNEQSAAHNREHFAGQGVLAVNLMGSPGSGKTAVLEATAHRLRDQLRILAVSGDLATDHDAARLQAAGIQSRAITTVTGCHLDAKLVHQALHDLPWQQADVLFIENVGNLVCPAVYDLGQTVNVVALSVTEGEDKPLKYPVMFHRADLVLWTKVDLLPHLPHVRREAFYDALQRTMPSPRVIELSALSGQGLPTWLDWLREQQLLLRAQAPLRPLGRGPVGDHTHG